MARHAAAQEVHLGLRLQDGRLTLTIADDGRGFLPDAPPAAQSGGVPRLAGTGLANMRRRVEFPGGTFELSSTTGRGTIITLQIPLSSSVHPQENEP